MKLNKEDRLFIERCSRIFTRLVASATYYTGHINNLIQNQNEPTWRIVSYQRITNPEEHYLPVSLNKYIRPSSFEKHLKYLSKECNVISLTKLVELIENEDKIPQKTVVITFDGGWEDNYRNAYPLLMRYRLPATFFISSAFIGTNNLFWPDKLAACMLALHKSGRHFSSIPFIQENFPSLISDTPETEAESISKMAAVINLLKEIDPKQRAVAIANFGILIEDIEEFIIEPSFLAWDQISKMNNPLIEFGSQGIAHKLCTEISDEEFASDIRESYVQFREHSLNQCNVFCYPEGVISKSSLETLNKLGIKYCLGLGKYEMPKTKISSTLILSRTPVYEEVSYCKEIFACKLWGVSPLGINY